MRKPSYKYLVGDFETTVFDNQQNTEVWASAIVEMGTEDVLIFHSIGETFEYLCSLKTNICLYYHNLKFDGAFWLSYLLVDLGMKQASVQNSEKEFDLYFVKDSEMKNNTFKYSISDMGQWYTITIKVHDKLIEIRDSLKLLPFSVKRIGDSFKTKHKKLDMEYKGFRYAGCEITDEEKAYISNDVLVIKEALEIMFQEGHKKLTIGSCCLDEYKRTMEQEEYRHLFPDLTQVFIDEKLYNAPTAERYIRKAYKGGWCYLVKGKESKRYYNGTTADVNSLYPSVMSGESGNLYPVGTPNFWKGNYIPETCYEPNRYYFVRIRTRFYIKEGKLPCIQIKGTLLYKGTEWLQSSDIYNPLTDKYYPYYTDDKGVSHPALVELTLTMTDFILIREHYELVDFEILDGCWFHAKVGIFDNYINKYKKIKMESKGAKRELAKLFLNNLYGKLASSTNSSFKYAFIREDKSIGFAEVREYAKKAGYIADGAAVTSYARNFTIRAAQKNYHGVNERGFIYADTDSIHCDLEPNEIVGINVHPTDFCCWKLEAQWDEAIFTRQKTYIEHIVAENKEPIENPYYNVKCAGMPDKCKDLFIKSMTGYVPKEGDEFTEDELEFLSTKRTLEDFSVGLRVPGKLLPKRIRGGVLLVGVPYEMR